MRRRRRSRPVTRQYVYAWEAGRRNPSPKHLAKLAEVLGLEIADLTIDRYRNGHSPVSAPIQKLMQKTWPLWWDFLTEQSNVLPNPQPQPEPVRVVEV